MIFKSKQVNLDPEPYTSIVVGDRFEFEEPGVGTIVYSPRPEFEPTRDPEPWAREAWSSYDKTWFVNARLAVRLDFFPLTLGEKFRVVWAPRREQFDTPVNRVLVAFRADDAPAQTWLDDIDLGSGEAVWVSATDEEFEHARKVLTRLAGAA